MNDWYCLIKILWFSVMIIEGSYIKNNILKYVNDLFDNNINIRGIYNRLKVI